MFPAQTNQAENVDLLNDFCARTKVVEEVDVFSANQSGGKRRPPQ